MFPRTKVAYHILVSSRDAGSNFVDFMIQHSSETISYRVLVQLSIMAIRVVTSCGPVG